MSYCYDIVLFLGAYNGQGYGQAENEEERMPPAIEYLNNWIADNERHGDECAFTRLTSLVETPYSPLMTDLWATATNGLNKDGLLQAVQDAPWSDIDNIQIFIREQDMFIGEVYSVWRGKIYKMETHGQPVIMASSASPL